MEYIIDVRTPAVNYLIRRLKRLKWVVSVEDGGKYNYDLTYSQVWLSTEKTEDEIDHWLWKYSHCDYVGVIENN